MFVKLSFFAKKVMLGSYGDWICECTDGYVRDEAGVCVSFLKIKLFDLIPENQPPGSYYLIITILISSAREMSEG